MNMQSAGRWFAGAVILAAAVTLSGQSAAPARQDDVVAALLVEVRGLRAAMEQLANAGPRVQLFASRLQLQEGRMSNMARRLDTVRDNLAASQREVARLQADLSRMESVVAEQRTAASLEAREEAKQAEAMLAQLRGQITIARATENRHAAEEAQLVQDLTSEQGRWLAINQQLDELERALSRK
jgi:chromosome segregation ATPase